MKGKAQKDESRGVFAVWNTMLVSRCTLLCPLACVSMLGWPTTEQNLSFTELA